MKTIATWIALCAPLFAFQSPARAQDENTAHVTQLQQLFPLESDIFPDGIPPDRTPPSNVGFGDQVARSGNTALVSMSSFGSNTGRVAIFTRNASGVWERTGSLDDPDAPPAARFGSSIALDEHGALIASSRGLYVYRRSPKGLTLIQRLRATDTRSFSVGALWHHWAFVPTTDNGERFVRVYLFTPRGLIPGQKLRSGGPADDGFPGDLAASNATLLVGAPNDDQKRGAAYVFEQRGIFWIRRQKLISMNPAPGDAFGSAVGLGGGTIAIGATGVKIPDTTGFGCGETGVPFFTGSVYVFTRTGHRLWSEQQVLPADQCIFNFGANVVADGDWIAATMPGEGLDQSTGAIVYHRENGEFVAVGGGGSTNNGIPSLDLHGRILFVGLHEERNLEGLDFGSVDILRLDESAP